MFWLYLIVAVVFLGFGMYKLGLVDIDDDDKFGLFWVIGVIAVLWPLVLTIVAIFGPFVGLFWLGDRKRKQRVQNKKTDK